MNTDDHFFKDTLATADKYIDRLLRQAETGETNILNQSIAAILVSRCRKHLRTMSQNEIYQITANIPSLKRKKASERKAISQAAYAMLNL